MVDLTKGCPQCGKRKFTEHVSGITQEVHYDNGFIVKEETCYQKNFKGSYVTCDNCGKKFRGPYEL